MKLPLQVPSVLLPASISSAWPVIACDQFTSEPEYWRDVKKIVKNDPSTLNLILPEIYLGKPEEEEIVKNIKKKMVEYEKSVLKPLQGMIYVERKIKNEIRQGVILAIDLAEYDYNKGSKSKIRPTEGTILDRIPPRVRIREGASLELPHVMVLVDDKKCTVIEPLAKSKKEKIYDVDLMLGGGNIKGYRIDEAPVLKALQNLLLASPDLLFAVGDGNHSLATAKAVWEKHKKMDHPSRFALVEVVNLHSPALEFEPIHRIVFDVKEDIIKRLVKDYAVDVKDCERSRIEGIITKTNDHAVGIVTKEKSVIVTFRKPVHKIPLGTMQTILDEKKFGTIDYVHGTEVIFNEVKKPNTTGIIVPTLKKSELFPTVIHDGALPRKTFSMGEAREKRYYLECRKIV
jgi:hypothetical protein